MKRSSSAIAVAFAVAMALALALPSLASALSFQETSQSPLPEMNGVTDVATGDFNGDGNSDLAVSCESGVVIWLSNGDGTFTKGETLPIESNANATATAVVVGDFNGDGKPDVAYSDGPYNVYVALGNGNGTFAAPTKFNAPFYIESGRMAAADFNGDHKDDLVMVGGIHSEGTEDANFQVFISNGDGTFTPKTPVPLSIPVNSYPVGLAVGDYNGDGNQDLALLVQPFSVADYTDNQVYGEEGQGNGTFTAASENPISVGLTAAGYAYGETTANLDGNGDEDLLVTTSQGDSTVPLLGSSSGFLTLNAAGALTGPALPFRVAAADLDGDGLDDAIPAYFDGNGTVGAGLSDGSGDLIAAEGSPYRVSQEDFFNTAVATGDFNDDGHPDIVIASNANTNGGPLTQGVAVLMNSRELGIAPTQLDFGDTKVGETTRRIVKLTGLGAPEAEVSQIELANSPDTPFSIADPSACETVAYGEECEVEVEYTPTSGSPSGDALLITSNAGPDGGNALSSVSLIGQGIAPGVALNPSSQDFGSVEIGGTPVSKTFAIRSTGDAPLTVTGVSLSSGSDFKLANPSACVRSVVEGSSCDVAVSFDPSGSAGPRSATLTVETDAGTRSAQLTGTAEPPAPPSSNQPAKTAATLELKAPATVKAGKQVKLKVTVSNAGNTAISGLVLTTKVPKKLAKAPGAVKVESLGAGQSVTSTIKVKLTKKAKKGQKLELTVSAATAGEALATGSRKVTVQ